MTAPEPLLSPTDFARFKAKDESWFLEAATEVIRDFCGWHIFPEIPVTDQAATIGNKGIIPLPTLQLVSVQALRLFLPPGSIAATSDTYIVNSSGSLQFYGFFSRQLRGVKVAVDYTHGFEEVPKAVAEVGFELAADALEKASGVVTDMTRGPTRIKFKDDLGLALSGHQMDRLGPYTLVRV